MKFDATTFSPCPNFTCLISACRANFPDRQGRIDRHTAHSGPLSVSNEMRGDTAGKAASPLKTLEWYDTSNERRAINSAIANLAILYCRNDLTIDHYQVPVTQIRSPELARAKNRTGTRPRLAALSSSFSSWRTDRFVLNALRTPPQ